MSVISQTTYLFSASLRSNMLLSSPEAGDNEIYNALDLAGLTNWVKEAPLGLDEWIGEQGKKMSAGECQRLAIARAFLQDTPILLLDEPTAHLDPITERGILRTIHKIAKGRSLLWVTHRMAGLEIMDEIMVMDRGSIVENGGHYDLLKKRGFYAKMWEIQNKNIL
jgi:ABC-type transport system involved in cytochrome bd biosynthesis fused ATPase/permease subunit